MMLRTLLLMMSAGLIFGLLVLPHHPDAMSWNVFKRFPIELPLILLMLIAIGRHRGVVVAVTFGLAATVVLKIADFAMFMAFDRAFNPILDFFLVDAGLNLLRDSIGTAGTILAAIATLIAVSALFYLLMRALSLWAEIEVPVLQRTIAVCAAGVLRRCWLPMSGIRLNTGRLRKVPQGPRGPRVWRYHGFWKRRPLLLIWSPFGRVLMKTSMQAGSPFLT